MYDDVKRWCEEIRMLLKKEISVRTISLLCRYCSTCECFYMCVMCVISLDVVVGWNVGFESVDASRRSERQHRRRRGFGDVEKHGTVVWQCRMVHMAVQIGSDFRSHLCVGASRFGTIVFCFFSIN